jgi:hypothetical protein
MKYILIIAYIYATNSAPSITTAEYNNKESCIKAGQMFKAAAGGRIIGTVYYSCSEK